MQRIAPSERLGQELERLLQFGLSQETGQAELRGMLIRLGTQRLLQELLEGEQRDFLGVDRYQRGAGRNGQRNGYEPAHMETGEGRIELQTPQVRGSDQPSPRRVASELVTFSICGQQSGPRRE